MSSSGALLDAVFAESLDSGVDLLPGSFLLGRLLGSEPDDRSTLARRQLHQASAGKIMQNTVRVTATASHRFSKNTLARNECPPLVGRGQTIPTHSIGWPGSMSSVS